MESLVIIYKLMSCEYVFNRPQQTNQIISSPSQADNHVKFKDNILPNIMHLWKWDRQTANYITRELKGQASNNFGYIQLALDLVFLW